jgi:hypothetical protein
MRTVVTQSSTEFGLLRTLVEKKKKRKLIERLRLVAEAVSKGCSALLVDSGAEVLFPS